MNDQSKAALTAPLGDLDMYIGGEWVSARSGKRMDVINPATGKAVGTVPEGGAKMRSAQSPPPPRPRTCCAG